MGVVNQNDINDIINANIEASEAIIKSVSEKACHQACGSRCEATAGIERCEHL